MLPEPVIIGVRLRCNADCGGDDNRIAIKRSFRPGVMNSVDRFKVKKLRHAVWRALGRFCETTWFQARGGELWVYCAVIKAEMLSGTSLRSLSWAKILQMARHESGICSLFKPGMGMRKRFCGTASILVCCVLFWLLCSVFSCTCIAGELAQCVPPVSSEFPTARIRGGRRKKVRIFMAL